MKYVILHGHIFKNAGTTFDWSLQKNFEKNFLDHRQDQLMRADGAGHLTHLLEEKGQMQAISSHHMTRDLPDLPHVSFLYVYILRHPIERMRSVYDFERKQRGSTPGSKAAKSKSFREYVEWRMSPKVAHTIRNYQTLYLAGYHGLADHSEIASKFFHQAINTLRDVQLVGVVDRYDESMVAMEEALREYFPDIDLAYVPQNVASGKRRNYSIEDAVARTFDELGSLAKSVVDQNSFDLALYQMAVSKLEKQISSIDNFKPKLEDFRKRCQRLRPRKLVSF